MLDYLGEAGKNRKVTRKRGKHVQVRRKRTGKSQAIGKVGGLNYFKV